MEGSRESAATHLGNFLRPEACRHLPPPAADLLKPAWKFGILERAASCDRSSGSATVDGPPMAGMYVRTYIHSYIMYIVTYLYMYVYEVHTWPVHSSTASACTCRPTEVPQAANLALRDTSAIRGRSRAQRTEQSGDRQLKYLLRMYCM